MLNENGLNTDNLIHTFKTDMCSPEGFGEVYVCFDEKGLYVTEFELPDIDLKKKSKKKKSKEPDELTPTLIKLESFPIDEIDEVFAEQYLATGQLTYSFNGEYYSLAYFSIGLLEKADLFRKIFKAFKEGKDYKQYILNANDRACIK